MRCYTCGFMNANGSKVCEKCGTNLKAAVTPPPPAAPPVSNNNNMRVPFEGVPTMRGTMSPQPAWDITPEAQYICEACGHYPLKAEVSKAHPCPNCKTTGEKPQPEEKPQHSGTMKFSNIFFGRGASAAPAKITLVDIGTNKPLSFEGEDIILNRANLNPNDQSISSSQHVQFTRDQDQWHLTDLSSNQATFIQVIGKVAVEDGAHVLIGNRVYRIEIA